MVTSPRRPGALGSRWHTEYACSLVAANGPLRSSRDAGRWAGVGNRLPGLVPVIPVRWLEPQLTKKRLSAECASTTPATWRVAIMIRVIDRRNRSVARDVFGVGRRGDLRRCKFHRTTPRISAFLPPAHSERNQQLCDTLGLLKDGKRSSRPAIQHMSVRALFGFGMATVRRYVRFGKSHGHAEAHAVVPLGWIAPAELVR